MAEARKTIMEEARLISIDRDTEKFYNEITQSNKVSYNSNINTNFFAQYL